jgi:hypothetical protein
MMDANVFRIVVPSLLIFLLGWIVSSTRSVRIATLQAQLQQALIDKIGSSDELRAYLESGAAERLLRWEPSPSEKALDSVRTGVVLAVSGPGMIAWAAFDSRVPLGIGLLTTALGVGCLAAGAATRYLAQRWRLPDRGPNAGENLNAR